FKKPKLGVPDERLGFFRFSPKEPFQTQDLYRTGFIYYLFPRLCSPALKIVVQACFMLVLS
ncbi:hypothetical protein L1D13_24155, partial [Vibrio tubiashii]|uniref:hypothetical protein n=1 Tax=Vibrio tubiashii TaxID=29498 RepID=UPI001EFD50BA